MTQHEAQGQGLIPSPENPLSKDFAELNSQPLAEKEEELLKIKAELLDLIDLMEVNFSFLARMSSSWAKISIRHKLLIGLSLLIAVIIIPQLIASIFLANLSIYSFLTYLVGGFLLEDDGKKKEDNKVRLKAGISRIANIFNEMIKHLNKLSAKLEGEVLLFQGENKELSSQVKNLGQEMGELTEERKKLVENNFNLEKNLQNFKEIIAEQAKSMEIVQKELAAARDAYEKNSAELAEKIEKLTLLKEREETLAQQVGNLTQQVSNLSETAETFKKTSILFQNLALRTCNDSSSELKDVLDKFNQQIIKSQTNTEKLEQLLDKLEQQSAKFDQFSKRCEEGVNPQANQSIPEATLENLGFSKDSFPKDIAALLKSQGLYGKPPMNTMPLIPEQEKTHGYVH